MPSASLQLWRNVRLGRLAEVDAQCAASIAQVPAQPNLVDENLRAYVLLLSAHFQGFCRDLYTECAQIIASKVRAALQVLIQDQFTAHRKLDRGNPNLANIRADFGRFGFNLDLPAADPNNSARIIHLGNLNTWRNTAAHHGNPPATITLDLTAVRDWRDSCDGLAASLDDVMYNQLRKLLRRDPW